jgi:hypothetical protein
MATMLSTIDNPFNPHTQFNEWKAYDESKGYYTCEYLARIAKVSDELSEEEEDYEINNAINEIVKLDILGIYMKVEEGP